MDQGGVIAYPTEAVYGLGCDPFNAHAIAKILQLKQRSIEKGFILIAERWEQVASLVLPIKPRALHQVLDTWPGPITWVFPANKDTVPKWIQGQHQGIAIRISNHPIVQALCYQFKKPLVSTSANIQGQPPIRDAHTVKMTFGHQINVIIDGKLGSQIHPTTIKDAITGEVIRK